MLTLSVRGFALFDAILGLVLFAIFATAGLLYLDKEQRDGIVEEAGRQVAILGNAASHYALTHYADAPGIFGTATWELNYSHLQTRGILPAAFPESDAMRRELRIWFRYVGSHPTHDRIQILAGQSNFEASDARIPLFGLFAGRGKVRLGVVRRNGCPPGLTAPCLVGPTVARTLPSHFDLSFIDHGGIMAFIEVTREEYCGDVVLRRASPTCPDSGELDALDMGGNILRSDAGAGRMEIGNAAAPSRIAVSNDMEAASLDITITGGRPGALVVERDAEVFGGLTVSGGLAIYGNVEVVGPSLSITDKFDIKADLDVEGSAQAPTVIVRGDMDILETGGENLNVDYLGANNCTAQGSSCNE